MSVAAQAPLLTRLSGLELAPGQIALWHLGQSSFALRAAGATVLIDPYLAPHPDRLVPPPFAPEEASAVDVIACTHDHLDHLDRETLPALAAASPEAIVVVPRPFADDVARLGIAPGRIVGAQPGETIGAGSVAIHVLPACHGDDPAAGYGFGRERSEGLYRSSATSLSPSGRGSSMRGTRSRSRGSRI